MQIILFPFPWRVRRFFFQKIYKYEIHSSARIGRSIILSRRLVMKENSIIRNGNLIKKIDLLCLNQGACIASFNLISGVSTAEIERYQINGDRKCQLILEENATITSRHFIDCNGGVVVGAYTTVAGNGTQILTHSIDPYLNREIAKPISIGKYCFVGTRCLFLPGTALPDYSILGGGSVVTKKLVVPSCLYAGAPAVVRKKLDIADVPYFSRTERVVD